jgi:uncharacterized protein with LGFP repeats
VTFWTLAMEWVYLLSIAQEGASVGCDFRSGETLVWMFYGLRNAVKNYVVISWPCTKGSVHGAKWRLSCHLASDEITNLWIKLCNLYRV